MVAINLEGKTALVTGGSRGIGAAVCKLLSEAGANVAFSYNSNKAEADSVSKTIEANGTKALAIKADLGIAQEARGLVEKTISAFGKIDILVINAGIWTYGAIGNLEESVWDETMAINLKGSYLVVDSAVKNLSAGASIILLSSTAGRRGEALHSHYAASKGALFSFAKSIAIELAPRNIRVNCVAPGWVDTDMNQGVFADLDFKEKARVGIPLGRIPTAADIAGPILFLASDLSRHMTGATLDVNGGSVLA